MSVARRRFYSIVIVVFLSLQAIAGFKLLCPPKSIESLRSFRICCSPKLWPFVDYPMYNKAYHEGDHLVRYELFAEDSDGRDWPLTKEDFGLDHRTFREALIGAVLRVDVDEIRPYLTRYEQTHSRRIQTLRLEDRGFTQTAEGLIEAPPRIVRKSFRVEAER